MYGAPLVVVQRCDGRAVAVQHVHQRPVDAQPPPQQRRGVHGELADVAALVPPPDAGDAEAVVVGRGEVEKEAVLCRVRLEAHSEEYRRRRGGIWGSRRGGWMPVPLVRRASPPLGWLWDVEPRDEVSLERGDTAVQKGVGAEAGLVGAAVALSSNKGGGGALGVVPGNGRVFLNDASRGKSFTICR